MMPEPRFGVRSQTRKPLVFLQRLAEHDQVKGYEVEGANDFLRASQQEHESLRRRPSRSQLPTSVPGSSSNNV